jgi:hypothetical protein
VLFFDEDRIVIDDTHPPVKHEWASPASRPASVQVRP